MGRKREKGTSHGLKSGKSTRSRKWKFFLVGFVVLVVLVLALAWTFRVQLWRLTHPPRIRKITEIPFKIPEAGILGEPVKGPGKREPGSINVVLVIVDTERADYLTPYGTILQTTPFLNEMAAQGITFSKMFSTSSWTTPAMFSIMTGLYPKEHGITSGTLIGQGNGRKVRGQEVLPSDAVTLAEMLKIHGYSTFGINTNHHMSPKYGNAQGFDRYAGENFSFLPYPNLMVEALAPEMKSASKYFLWLHYFDPHFPYREMGPWFSKWNISAFKTSIDFSTDLTLRVFHKYQGREADGLIETKYVDHLYKFTKILAANQNVISGGMAYLDSGPFEDYMNYLVAAYLSEIRYTDEAIKKALDILGIDDQTLVIITADHGEEIFDHGRLGHRHSLYQELLHVPLVIRLPGKLRAGTVVDTPVSSVDILPTVLDLLNLPVPEDLLGVSLKPLIEGKKIPPRPLYSEVRNRKGVERCLFEYPWKLIYKYKTQEVELYNLKTDPKEKNNLALTEKSRVNAMQKRLFDWVDDTELRWKTTKVKPLSKKELKQLQKMGYIQ
ncbi:MAG: sulfatase-like hydrolase/transferase [Proteobacteria bacterium]|nr:sulfatase-like hydrolase/transferase [Pseudomonadota bacterium]